MRASGGGGALCLCLLLIASIMAPNMGHQILDNIDNKGEVIVIHENWSTNGATRTDLNISEEGKPIMKRPDLPFSSVNSILMAKTGATSVAIPELGEVWVIGGREDPNPSQSNDEMATNVVEAYDFVNDSWNVAGVMNKEQQYAGAGRRST